MLKLRSGTRGAKEIIETIRLKEDLNLNKPPNLEVAIIGAGISGIMSRNDSNVERQIIEDFSESKFIKLSKRVARKMQEKHQLHYCFDST